MGALLLQIRNRQTGLSRLARFLCRREPDGRRPRTPLERWRHFAEGRYPLTS